jgi:hypothetical protein
MHTFGRSPFHALILLCSAGGLVACGDNGGVATVTESSTGGASTGQATDATTNINPTTPTSTTDDNPTTTGNSGEMTGSTTAVTASTTDNTTSTTDVSTTGGMTEPSTTSTADTTAGETTGVGETTGAETGSETGENCPKDTVVCEGGTAKVCDGQGGFSSEEVCAKVCLEGKGCAECVPDSATCEGEVSKVCNQEGSGTVDVLCDAVQGVTCDPNAGACVGVCSPAELKLSYIGCDYYPTVTANIVATSFNFAVVVANTTGQTAKIRIDRGNNTVATDTVPANGVKVIKLPWVLELKANENASSLLVTDGAYRLRSDQPVTVYQFSPIEYAQGGFSNSFTNDASLMLPVNAWSGDYWVAARNSWLWNGQVNYPGFYAVTASADNTKVTLAPSSTGNVVRAGGGVAANGTGVVTLNQGDVLEVFSQGSLPEPAQSDLTGTHVTADKPIQVIGGHICTFIPHNIGYCDHLEESMPPYETLAKEYIVTPPLIPTGGNVPKPHMVRIIATEAGTTLTYDPPQNGAPAALANPGDYVEIAKTGADFKITSNNKILVSQYMQGQDAGGNSGDPAMALAVPIAQYRTKYLFHAPINYEKNFANLVAPADAKVTLDGAAVAGFVPIGNTGFGVVRVALANNVDGNHDIISDKPIGVSVYGYGQYTSYWYPGGLDLDVIPQ